jgi:hypothetical protein
MRLSSRKTIFDVLHNKPNQFVMTGTGPTCVKGCYTSWLGNAYYSVSPNCTAPTPAQTLLPALPAWWLDAPYGFRVSGTTRYDGVYLREPIRCNQRAAYQRHDGRYALFSVYGGGTTDSWLIGDSARLADCALEGWVVSATTCGPARSGPASVDCERRWLERQDALALDEQCRGARYNWLVGEAETATWCMRTGARVSVLRDPELPSKATAQQRLCEAFSCGSTVEDPTKPSKAGQCTDQPAATPSGSTAQPVCKCKQNWVGKHCRDMCYHGTFHASSVWPGFSAARCTNCTNGYSGVYCSDPSSLTVNSGFFTGTASSRLKLLWQE